MVNRRQIRLSILRKQVDVGVFAIPDHFFDNGSQQASLFFQRCRIHRIGELLYHFLMEGKLLMQHPALLSEGFQLRKPCLLRLALPVELVNLLHDVFG